MKYRSCPACQGANLDKFIQPIILHMLKEEPGQTAYRIAKNIGGYITCSESRADITGIYRYMKNMCVKGLLRTEKTAEGDLLYYVTRGGEHCLSTWGETLDGYIVKLQILKEQLK